MQRRENTDLCYTCERQSGGNSKREPDQIFPLLVRPIYQNLRVRDSNGFTNCWETIGANKRRFRIMMAIDRFLVWKWIVRFGAQNDDVSGSNSSRTKWNESMLCRLCSFHGVEDCCWQRIRYPQRCNSSCVVGHPSIGTLYASLWSVQHTYA